MPKTPIQTWFFVLVVVRLGPDVRAIFDYCDRGAPVMPLWVLAHEADPYP